MDAGKVPLEKMTLRCRRMEDTKPKPVEGLVEVVFPTCLEHDRDCKKRKDQWLREIDPKTGAVTLSCDKCKAVHVFDIGAVEE
jgi:hypothetical protein